MSPGGGPLRTMAWNADLFVSGLRLKYPGPMRQYMHQQRLHGPACEDRRSSKAGQKSGVSGTTVSAWVELGTIEDSRAIRSLQWWFSLNFESWRETGRKRNQERFLAALGMTGLGLVARMAEMDSI